MQSNNSSTPQSSASSSSLSSSSSSSSITSATSATSSTNKKYLNNYSNSISSSTSGASIDRHIPSAKRKLTGFHHHNHSNYASGSSYQINKHQQLNSIKPFYSEYLNAKCVLYVYFKGDILTAIDDHFQKSFLLSQSNVKSKISTPASSPSSTSSNSTRNLNDYSSSIFCFLILL